MLSAMLFSGYYSQSGALFTQASGCVGVIVPFSYNAVVSSGQFSNFPILPSGSVWHGGGFSGRSPKIPSDLDELIQQSKKSNPFYTKDRG